MQNPYKEMYHRVVSATTKAETLLEETLAAMYSISDEARNRDQIAVGILTTQMQNVIDDLRDALSEAEDMLLDAAE